jgi:hypothetical protein
MKPGSDDASALADRTRLLRLLAETGGAGQAIDGGRLVVRHAGRNHSFAMETVRLSLHEGLVAADGGKLRLTGEGSAFLKRLSSATDGYADGNSIRPGSMPSPGSARVRVNPAESPLSRLSLRRDAHGNAFLSEAEFSAGERFRAEFERAGLQPRISANWEAAVASGGRGGTAAEISDFSIDARKRLGKAIEALGPELSGVALDVCCFLKGLEQVERERRWPPRSAKLMLKTALSLLARHYGLAGMREGRATVRHWGDADYRPAIARGT